MNRLEEELQSQIEKQLNAEGIDASSYRKIFNALKKEPTYSLPAAFSDDIIKRIEMTRPSTSSDRLWFALGIAGFVVAALVTILLTGFKLSAGTFKFLSGYSGLLIFGIAFVLLLQFFDKKFIRPLTN